VVWVNLLIYVVLIVSAAGLARALDGPLGGQRAAPGAGQRPWARVHSQGVAADQVMPNFLG
jgi:hypothetical protein